MKIPISRTTRKHQSIDGYLSWIAALWLCLSANCLASVTINWSSDIGQTNYDSKGVDLNDNYVFELGGFDTGFVLSDPSTWAENWNSLDRTSYQRAQSFFGKSTVLDLNTEDFPLGGKAYIWGYRPSGPTSEWILISDPSWVWPDASAVLAFPKNWEISSASEPLYGAINQPSFQMQTQTTGASTPLIVWADWINLHFTSTEASNSAISGLDADPDGDGLLNRFEYAFGHNPRIAAMLPSGLTLSFVENKRHLSIGISPSAQVNFNIRSSTSLTSWSDASGEFSPMLQNGYSISWLALAPVIRSKEFFELEVQVP